ncbi:phosphoribosylanthranilate isomerase [Fictibacillus fluitans]|uniref:N-(5'-phosphoribosyl)anthranilate isomerase n=1 Tax=Fictibacillus fluitans TaxID=3058422 RepID=A0ABT8I3M1_9BACL|nr:phosphoribosylanthranilate isomerase [Fictibacillus sp. NE201]MDN4527636.1 phosphoribosylanthranilate isomerase [Fictibacillus sp. NE201]
MVNKDIAVKYCGCRSREDLELVQNSSAGYAGFIFAPSKRKVVPDEVARWINKLQPLSQKLVGVFVNPSAEEVEHALDLLPLDVIQCHGDESPEFLKLLKNKTGKIMWKAIRHEEEGWTALEDYAGIADGYVIDARVEGAYGGTGTAFDWEAVPFYLEEASRQEVPCFIAGGISANNITRLLSYQPHGIDISSGIEKDGKKSKEAITELEGMIINENSIS